MDGITGLSRRLIAFMAAFSLVFVSVAPATAVLTDISAGTAQTLPEIEFVPETAAGTGMDLETYGASRALFPLADMTATFTEISLPIQSKLLPNLQLRSIGREFSNGAPRLLKSSASTQRPASSPAEIVSDPALQEGSPASSSQKLEEAPAFTAAENSSSLDPNAWNHYWQGAANPRPVSSPSGYYETHGRLFLQHPGLRENRRATFLPAPITPQYSSLIPIFGLVLLHAPPAAVILKLAEIALAFGAAYLASKGLRPALTRWARRDGWRRRTLYISRSVLDWAAWSMAAGLAFHFAGIFNAAWAAAAAILIALGLFAHRAERIVLYNADFKVFSDLKAHGFTDIPLTTSDGEKIHGWYRANRPGSPTLLYLIGARGNSSMRLDRLYLLRDLGLSVFILDYRGYGPSEGEPSKKGTDRDAEAALQYLTTQLKIPLDQIMLYGESIGGNVLTHLGLNAKVKGAVIENSPTSMLDMARVKARFLPVRLFVPDAYNALSEISKLEFPVMIIHGTEDQLVPYGMGAQLAKAAKWLYKFVTVAGGHNQGYKMSRDTYVQALTEFLDTQFPNRPRHPSSK